MNIRLLKNVEFENRIYLAGQAYPFTDEQAAMLIEHGEAVAVAVPVAELYHAPKPVAPEPEAHIPETPKRGRK